MSSAETEVWMLDNHTLLENVHPAAVCDGTPCPFHSPSDHLLRDAPLRFSNYVARDGIDRYSLSHGVMLRICDHGEPHLDPDWKWFMVHIEHHEVPECLCGCCGCCSIQ